MVYGEGRQVAPRSGAWIEMRLVCVKYPACQVAPRSGAWIEMVGQWGTRSCLASLPVRERGLKLLDKASEYAKRVVAPRSGAWIEIGI